MPFSACHLESHCIPRIFCKYVSSSETHEDDSDTLKIRVSDQLSGHTFELGEDLQNSKKNWIHKTVKRLRPIRINNMRLNEFEDGYNFYELLFEIVLVR